VAVEGGTQGAPRESRALDPRGRAVGDPYGLAISLDGRWLSISAAGSAELLLYQLPLPFVAYGGPGDLIEPELLREDGRFRRVALGGRPMGIRFTPDSRQVVVANHGLDALQVVDVAEGRLAGAVALGGPAAPDAARRGEALFYDATRAFNQWFSCGSCHVEGDTNRQLYDTFNDGRYGNGAKLTPSLRGVARTGPWTWHGWQDSLEAAIAASFETTQQGRKLTESEIGDVAAYLASLTPRPARPGRSETPAARRGGLLFEGKAGCVTCHPAPQFTDGRVHELGPAPPSDRYRGYNPPSLLGVGTRPPYLHDGRAGSLDSLLTEHHLPERLAAPGPLTPAERADLIAYLESL
jgi:cytochrome c peroxidase